MADNEEKLVKMLKYVSEHNDFYKKRIKEYGITNPLDITQWPILTRKELQENRYNMFSDGYKSKYFNQQLRRQASSGSTGVPVNVYWDYRDWYASNMSLWRRRFRWYGIKPAEKYVMFTLNAFNVKSDNQTVYYMRESTNILLINVSLIQNEKGYEKLIVIINEFEPKWLYIQPFVLNKLIQAYKRTGKSPPRTLRYIESVGELLASDLRKRASEFFEVPLANMYGSEEMNGIAYECPEHHMHVLTDNVLAERINKDGIRNYGSGQTIITGLNNTAMPLIRYNQGDMYVLENSGGMCVCGSNEPIVEMIKGRSFENIILNDGTEINAFLLLEVMAEVNNMFNFVIRQFEYIFIKSVKTLQCHVLVEKNNSTTWFTNIAEAVQQVFKEKIGFTDHISLVVLKGDVKFEHSLKPQILKIMQ